MTKKKTAYKTKAEAIVANKANKKALEIIENSLITRESFLNKLLDPRRNLYEECGYPENLTIENYKRFYDRNGVGYRVCNVYPEACWSVEPAIYEVEDEDNETEFEKAFNSLIKKVDLFHYWARADELSGIGYYGVIFLGLDDGKEFKEPVDGIDEEGKRVEGASPENKLLYCRAFDQSLATVNEYEKDKTNPRYGLPTSYNIKFSDPSLQSLGVTVPEHQDVKVHWSRVIHVSLNRGNSEVFSTPMMQPVANYLLNLEKIVGGSAEMFYKGGFPGYALEVNPEIAKQAIVEREDISDEMFNMFNGLQRWTLLQGITVNSLEPQVADPSNHFLTNIKAIAVTINTPYRVFMGSEEGKLAGEKDEEKWNERIARRQNRILTPLLIRETIDRLIICGVLPETGKNEFTEQYEYCVDWPDMASTSELDQATIAKTKTEALSAYIQGDVSTLIPPLDYLTKVLQLTLDEAKAVLEAAADQIEVMEEEDALEAEEQAEQFANQDPIITKGGSMPPGQDGKQESMPPGKQGPQQGPPQPAKPKLPTAARQVKQGVK